MTVTLCACAHAHTHKQLHVLNIDSHQFILFNLLYIICTYICTYMLCVLCVLAVEYMQVYTVLINNAADL